MRRVSAAFPLRPLRSQAKAGPQLSKRQPNPPFRQTIFTFALLLFLYESRFYPVFTRLFSRSEPPFFDLQIVPTVGSPFSPIHAIMPA